MGLLASLFVKIGADTKDLQKGLTGAKQGLGDVTKGVMSSVLGFATFSGAVLAAGKALKDTINDTVAYAEQVRQLSRTIGSTPEEASKLIQAADDVKVSFETMQTAMNIAIKKGLDPTIDGMGALADEYVAIQDPIDRSRFLLENFGRSGGEMAALMEIGADGIRELGDAAESTGLVLSQVDLDATRTYEKALDELSDTFEGMKIEVGLEIIPIVTTAIGDISVATKSNRLYSDSIDMLRKGLKTGAIDFKEYNTAVKELSDIFWKTDFRNPDFIPNLEEQKSKIQELTMSQDELVVSIFDATNSWGEFTTKMGNAGIGLGMITEELYYEEKAATKAAIATKEATGSFADNDGTMAIYSAMLDGVTDSYHEAADAVRDDLVVALGDLENAQKSWKESVGGDIVGTFLQLAKDAGLSTDEIVSRLQTVDDMFGTNKAYEFQLNLKTDEMAALLLTDPAAFAAEGQKLVEFFMPLDEAVKDAQDEVTILQGQLNALEKTYYAKVKLITSGFDGTTPKPYAKGGSFSAGQMMLVGERGPELLVPDQNGYIVPNEDLAKRAAGLNQDSGTSGDTLVLSDILMAIRSQPAMMKVALKEAVALLGG